VQHALISSPRGSLGGGSSRVTSTANFEARGPRLAHAEYGQAQCVPFGFEVDDSPYYISFRRPQVKQASVSLARNGIFGMGQIEGDDSILEYDGIACGGKKTFHGL
jgi:hypothetical protein